MSLLTHRSNTVFATASDGKFIAGAGTVVVLPPGGIASQDSNSNSITLYTGHGFVGGEKLMVGVGEASFTGLYTVDSVAGDVITLGTGAVVNVVTGDRIINLGDDSGVSSPNYDGSTVLIYSTPALPQSLRIAGSP